MPPSNRPSAPAPTAVDGVYTVELHPSDPTLELVSGRRYLVTVLSDDPWRGWNQRLRRDGRFNMVAGEEATFKTFRDRFGVSEDDTAEWFRDHGLVAYLPRDAPGVLGFLGRQEYPAVPRDTTRITTRMLRPHVETLTPQQIADHLVLAIEHTKRSDHVYLSIPRYFRGVEESVKGVTMRIGGRRIPVSRIELPVNYLNSDRISLHGDPKQVFVPDADGELVARYNVVLSTASEGSYSSWMLSFQFLTDDDSEAFLNFLMPRNASD